MEVLSDDHSRHMKESMEEETEQFYGPSSLTKKNGCEGELKQAIKVLTELGEQVKKLLPYWSKLELNSGIDIVIFSNMLEQIGQKEVGDKLNKIGANICFWESKAMGVPNVVKKILQD